MGLIEQQQFEQVEGIRTGKYPWRLNTTVFFYRLGATLIDSGPANQWPVVRQYVKQHSLRRVLITHHHEDHSGNAGHLQKEFGLPVLAPEKAVAFLEHGFPIQFYRRLIWGIPPPVKARPFPEQIELEDGFRLMPIPTPGHAPDHTCLLEPDKGWLFTADLFIAEKLFYLRPEEDPHQEIESLERVLSYPFQVVFCAHRGIVQQGREAMQKKLAFLKQLREQARDLYARGYSVEEIQQRLLGRETGMAWFTLGHFTKRNLVRALLRQNGMAREKTPAAG